MGALKTFSLVKPGPRAVETSVNPRAALLTSDLPSQITASTRSIDSNAVPGND
jgi:hypothetical protein